MLSRFVTREDEGNRDHYEGNHERSFATDATTGARKAWNLVDDSEVTKSIDRESALKPKAGSESAQGCQAGRGIGDKKVACGKIMPPAGPRWCP